MIAEGAHDADLPFSLCDARRIARETKDQLLVHHDHVDILAMVQEPDGGHDHTWIRLVHALCVACQLVLHRPLLACSVQRGGCSESCMSTSCMAGRSPC